MQVGAELAYVPVSDDGLLIDYGRVTPAAFERALSSIAAELADPQRR